MYMLSRISAAKPVVIAVLVIGVAILLIAGWRYVEANNQPLGLEIGPKPTTDVVLVDQHGDPYQLASDDRGKVRVITFGYTHCPDVCPMIMVTFRDVEAELGDQADEVQFIFITVDPERDTPERLNDYVPRFSENFIGLTGDRETLEKVWEEFAVYAKKEPSEDPDAYYVTHSALTYLVDRSSQKRLALSYGTSVEDMLHDIRILLRERAADE